MKVKEARMASTSIRRVRSMFSLPFGWAYPEAASRQVPGEVEKSATVGGRLLNP